MNQTASSAYRSPVGAASDQTRPEGRGSNSRIASALTLAIWLVAGVVPFLPFALSTSPLDAVLLHVPGNQGNWWHFLAAAPFFLAFPMAWLHLRELVGSAPSTAMGRKLIWAAGGLSVCGTILVETPFLLHLAGTSDWQRFIVLGLGFGIMLLSAVTLFFRRRDMGATSACRAALITAWLANASLCLVVYAGAPGSLATRSGWFVTVAIFWPAAAELAWIFAQSFLRPTLDGGLAQKT